MTAAAIGYLQRQYACVLRRCALASGFGMSFMVALPPTFGQTVNVVPDNRTATQVSQQNGLATVTTATTRGVNAFNSFSRFDVGSGLQVNLMLPDGTSNLINTVSGARSQIDGWVNAYKAGRIGGNVYFFNTEGFVVGASGVLNAGSLTLAAPSAAFLGQLIDGQGRIGDGAVLQALTGTYPLSASGLVRIQGRLNAADAVTLAAGQVSTDTTAQLAAGPAGAAQFAALVNVAGLDSAAGVSTAGGRIRLVGSGDVSVAGDVRAAAGGDATLTVQAGSNITVSGAATQLQSGGAPVSLVAGGKIALDAALLSSRDLGAAGGSAAQHNAAASQGPSGAIELAATQIELRSGARVLAQGSSGQAGATVRLSASDDATRAVFGSTEDQSARIDLTGSTIKGADVLLRATADDKYVFAASQAAQNPTPFQSLENTLLDFVTSLRLFADVTVSKAEAAINVGGGSLLQATTGDVDLRATSRAEAKMNVRSTIIGFGYGETTSRASVAIGQATLQAGRDLLLKSQADSTLSVEVGTSNLGNTSNNASNPTGYVNAAVAVGIAEQTSSVRTGAGAQLSAGRALSLDAGGAKSFEVASSGGSFQDGLASAGISVGLSKTHFDAQLGGTAQAGSVRVNALLDDATTSVQAAAGTAGKPLNVQEAVTSARTLEGSFIEGLTGLIAKIPSTDGRSGNKEKFGLSASVAFADIDNRVRAGIVAGAQVTSGGSSAVTAQATDTAIFRASAAVDERDKPAPGAGNDAGSQDNKTVAISGAVVVADMDHVTAATIGDGASVFSAGALDVTSHATLLPGWQPHVELIQQLRDMDWKSTAAYADLALKLKDVVTKPSQGNTWTQNSVESEKLSLTAAVTYLTLDNQATARIGAAQINAGVGANSTPATAAQDVRVSALAEQGMLHLTGVPEMDATLLSSNSGSGKAGVGGSYLQFVMGGGSDASIASGATVRADDLAVSARTDFDQIMVTETAGKAGKLSINGSFSMLQSDLSTVAQIAAGSTINAGNVLLLAHDDSLVVNIAGGVARSGSIGVGFAVALNEMDRNTQALLGNRDAENAIGGTLTARGNLLLDARSAGTGGAFALAGSGPSGGSSEAGKGGDGSKKAGSDSGQQGSSGIGISAAASVNIVGDHTTARVRDLASVSVGSAALTAANPTLNLAAAGGLTIANGKTAGLAGAFTWNQLEKNTQAGFANTRVNAAAGIAANALNSNAAWSVSVGANAGGKVGVAGSVSYSTVANTSLAQAVDAQLQAGAAVRLRADDDASIRSVAGAASYGGKAGFGAALGLAEVENTTAAEVVRGSVDAAALDTRARSGNEIISVAAALGVSQGIAGSGAVTVNTIANETRAGTQFAAVQAGSGAASFSARDESSILSVAGSVALTTGSASIGIAAAYNDIDNRTTAQAIGGSVAGSTLTFEAREASDIEAIAAGGSGAANVGVTGSLGINRIGNTTTARANGAALTASAGLNVLASDSADLQSITGAASAAGTAAVGASASYNEVDSTVTALVQGGTLDAADIAIKAQRAATLDVWAIAGTAGGTAGIAGSIAMNLAGGSTLARVEAGARVSARNNALLLGDSDDFIKSRAGAAAVGGTVGAGGAIAFNDITSSTAAEVSGAGTLLEGLAQSATGVAVPNGTLTARSTTQLPSDHPLAGRQQTELLRGAGVVAASTAAVENFAVTLAGGGTAGVAGTVTVSMMGGSTRARVDDQARINRAQTSGVAAQQGLIAAYHHDQLFSGTGGGAIGATAGVGGAADTALISHTTSATLDHAALAGRAAARVVSGSTSEITQGVIGLGGGLVGLAGSIGVILSQGTTQTLVDHGEIDSAAGRIDVLASSRTDTDVAAGAVAAGAVGVGITATVTLAEQQTTARTVDTRLDAIGTTTVGADSDFTQHVYGATASIAGAVGVAGTVDVVVMKGSTQAEIGSGSRVNTRARNAAPGTTQDVVVSADDSVRIDNKVGGLGVGVGVGASAAVDVVLLRSGASASIAGGADVRAGRDIRVEADAHRDIDTLAIAGGAGLTAGIAGAVSVVSVGVRPDADSNDNASGSVAKASELTRGSSTGNQLGSSGGARAQAARGKADGARSRIDLSGDLAATPTRQSAEAAVAGTARLTADRDVSVDAHTRNDIDAKAVGVALSAGASLGGGFAVALSEERTRASLAGRTRAGRNVRVQAQDDQSGIASQQAYAGGGGAVGLAASLALNHKASSTVAELGGTLQAGGNVTVDSSVNHGLEAKGLGAALGLVGIGAAIGSTSDTSLADARVADASRITAASLAVRGSAGSSASTDVTAAAGGLFAGGAGADADTDNRVRASTTVGNDVRLQLGGGSAEFTATATPRGVAVARGVAVSAGYSMGISVADVEIGSNASVNIGDRLQVDAGSLTLQAETTRQRIGTGPLNLPLYAPSAEAESMAAAGGLLVGASATEASASVRPSTQVRVGSGGTLTLSGGFAARALSDVDARSDVTGINIGLIAAGGNRASTAVHSDTQALIGAGRLTAQTVSLRSDSNDALGAASTSGAGGLGVVLAARVENQASANTVTRLAGNVDARSVDLDAAHTTRLHGEADSTSASVAGYAGANVINTVANRTTAELGAGSAVNATAYTQDALSTVAKDSANADWAVRAASGGVLAGSSGGTLTTIDNITHSVVGDGARLTTTDRGTQAATLAIGARNRLDVFDSVLLDTGGAIALAKTESFVDARRNDAQVRIGSGALLKSRREVQIEASTSGVVDTEAQSKTYGLAGAAEGETRSRIVTANGITLDGGRIESDENVRLLAGVGNVLRADAETRLWNRTAVPIPSSPDALAAIVQDNRIVIRPYALPAGTPLSSDAREAQVQRAAIATVRDIELLAGGGQRALRGFGRGTDLYREALQALGRLFDSDLSLDIQAGRELDLAGSTVQVDGTLFAGTRWRQFLDIGSAGQVLRQSEGMRFSTRDNVDLGREIDTSINALKVLVATYSDIPTVAAGFQADIDVLQARRAQLGVGAKVGFIDLDPAMATSGNIRITGGALVGGAGGELVAPGDSSIRVNNASNRFLSVKNLPGNAACPAALCIPGDTGGEITLNGARVASNADINSRNDSRNAPGATAAFGRIDERSNSPAPLIELRNSADGTTPKPEIQVYGNILNPRGTVRVASTGSVTVSSDVTAQTVDIATQGDFIKTFSLGYTHTAGDPTLVIKSLTDAEEAASRRRFPAATDPLTSTISPLTSSDTVAKVSQPTGTVIAGNNVFISGEKLNLNGVIQSGVADVRVLIDSGALADAKNAQGAWVPLRNTAFANLDAALRPKLRWNAAAQELELGNIQVEGGYMQLFGDILSTGGGQLNVLDGFGRIQIENTTATPLLLNRLDTGAGTQGKIRITDTSTRDAVGNNLVTTITRSNGQVVTTQENVATKDNARPVAAAVSSDASGRSAQYTPRADRRLNWINADNITVSYSQIYTRTCAVSCDFGSLADWLAKNAPTQTVVVSPPAVYKPRISGLWLSKSDPRSADYIYDFRKERFDRGATSEYFTRRFRSGGVDFYDNIETRRDWSWKERNFFTHSLAASRPVAIRFIGEDVGTLSVHSARAPIKLGDTLRNLKGTTTLNAARIGLAGGATAGQVVGDTLVLRARDGAIGEFGGSDMRPLEVQLSATGSVELRATTDIALRAYQGGLRLGRTEAGGRLSLQAEGDIVRGGGASSALTASEIRLVSDNGSLGSLAAPLLINLPADRGTLDAHAARDIGIAEATGDLRVRQVASSGGDVLLRAAQGAIVDVDSVQSVNAETRDALLGVARRAGLTANSGAQAGIDATVRRYEQGKRQAYLAYWQMRGLKERFDSRGASLGYSAGAYNPAFVYTVDPAIAAQLKQANGWSDAQLTTWRDSQTAFYHQAAAEFGNGDARSYNPAWHFNAAAQPTLLAALGNGGVWTEAQITQRVAAGLFKDTADTQILVENPNVSGRRISLDARDGIGRASTALEISRDPRLWTADQQLALLAADRADLQVTPSSVRITPKDDLDLAMRSGGAVNAKAGASIFLGSEGDLRLDRVVSNSGDVRIKARGSLTQLAPSGTAVSGRDVLVEAGGGALGAADASLTVATTAGGSVSARSALDLHLAAERDLVIDQVFTPAAAWLTAPGAITERLATADLNVRAGALTLDAATTIGLPGDPLAALDVWVTGPLTVRAGRGAWLAVSGDGLTLASALVQNGPLRIAAEVPQLRITGPVKAGTSVDIDSAGQLTIDAAGRIEAGSLTLNADTRLQNLGTLTVTDSAALSAGDALLLAGNQQLLGATTLNAGTTLDLRGSTRIGGALTARAGGALRQQGSLALLSNARFDVLGTAVLRGSVTARGALSLLAGGDLSIDGMLQIGGPALLSAGSDWALRGVLLAQTIDARAGRDLSFGGLVRSNGNAVATAGRDLRFSGIFGAGGSLQATATRDLFVLGQMPVATQGVTLKAGRRKVAPAGTL